MVSMYRYVYVRTNQLDFNSIELPNLFQDLESAEGWKLVRKLLSDLKAGYEYEQGTL
jgi:hypothetical protein